MDRQQLRDQWRHTIDDEGGHCPVCDRWGRVYARGINNTMARALIWLYQQTGDKDGWVDVPTTAPQWLVRSNQLATLHWWGLVERKSKDETHRAKFSGIWRSTKLGREFAQGEVRVPKKVFTYMGNVEGTSTEEVSISECFKEVFSYEEVMGKYEQQRLFS